MENNIELEEKLISFETAKLAKKKGFNVHCRWHFDDENGDLYENEDFPYNSWNGSLFAPTQSLLQKWLREEYEIHLVCWWYDKEDKFYTELGRRKENSIKVQTGNVTNLFDTYENALEAGLLEALKLMR